MIMADFYANEPPLPVHRQAKGLSQQQLIDELIANGRNPTGFAYDDIEELQKVYDAQFELMKIDREAWLKAERQIGIDRVVAQQKAREKQRDSQRIEKELKANTDVVNWVSLLHKGHCNKAAVFNSRTPAMALHIVTSIPAPESVLTSLELCRCRIDNHVAQAIGAMLRQNRSIQRLQLSDNSIASPGLKHIAEALKVNNVLKALDLSHNPLVCASGSRVPPKPPRDSEHLSLPPITGAAAATTTTTTTTTMATSDVALTPSVQAGLPAPSRTNSLMPPHGNPVPDDPALDYAGLDALKSALEQNTTLQVLSLQTCGFDRAAARRVVDGMEQNSTLVVLEMDTTDLSVAKLEDLHRCLADNQRVRAERKARDYKERIEKCKKAKAERLAAEKERRRVEEAQWARQNRMERLQAREEQMLQAAKDAVRKQREEVEAQEVAAREAAVAEAREASRPVSTKKKRRPKPSKGRSGAGAPGGGRSKKSSGKRGGGAGGRRKFAKSRTGGRPRSRSPGGKNGKSGKAAKKTMGAAPKKPIR